jgi:N-acetylglucosamine kinase-like BadF-type ATPase
VTGFGELTGEAAGSSELVYRAMQLVAQAWTKRGPETALTELFIDFSGARDTEDLLEGYTTGRIQINGSVAPLIFQIAKDGDSVAKELIHWAGEELAELVKAVIRQLNFHS